jgi:DNA-binding GntR family transcriptional regulator
MRNSTMFSPVNLPTLKHNVIELVAEAIFSGKIKPGERLNESQLARELCVSRAPIREALLRLQEQGLVLNHPRRGMFVVHLEADDILNINAVRVLLEGEALRLCRKNLTRQREAKLIQLLERMERSESLGPHARVHLDLDFHRAIWSQAGNQYLERLLVGLTAPLFAHAVLSNRKIDEVRDIIKSHRPLLAFVQGKSKESAENVLAAHLKIPWSPPGYSPNLT